MKTINLTEGEQAALEQLLIEKFKKDTNCFEVDVISSLIEKVGSEETVKELNKIFPFG